MPDKDKDELARMLDSLAQGEHTEEEAKLEEQEENAAAHAPLPEPPPTAPPPAAPPKLKAPIPHIAPLSALPREPMPSQSADLWPVVPAPASPRPQPERDKAGFSAPLPPKPAADRAGMKPSPAAPPQPMRQMEAVVEDVEDQDAADDQMSMPAPPESVFLRQASAAPRRVHLSQTVFFKRTIIPILITLGVIGCGLIVLGYSAEPDSPFEAFKALWFAIPVGVISLLFMGLAVATMLQVRHQIQSEGK